MHCASRRQVNEEERGGVGGREGVRQKQDELAGKD